MIRKRVGAIDSYLLKAFINFKLNSLDRTYRTWDIMSTILKKVVIRKSNNVMSLKKKICTCVDVKNNTDLNYLHMVTLR